MSIDEDNEEHKSAVLSRYHWRLYTIWTGLVLSNNKPKISFFWNWNTPVAQCRDYTHTFGSPFNKEGLSPMDSWHRYKGKILNDIFVGGILPFVDTMFDGQPLPYSDLVTSEQVDDEYLFAWERIFGVAVIGPVSDIPNSTRNETNS